MNTIDNAQDVMDSRDVIERLEELRAEHTDLIESGVETNNAYNNTHIDDKTELKADAEEAATALAKWEEDYLEELNHLEKFTSELTGYGDWIYGETLIRDSYFTEYAEELANDIGAVNDDDQASWPKRHIDWEAAANELKMDYTCADLDGVTYWMRA